MASKAVQSRLSHAQLATVSEASRDESDGGAPTKPGIYAWWVRMTALPDVPTPPHPTEEGWGLLYVGVCPQNEQSSERLRSRLLDRHINGNTRTSTLKFALAAVLGYRPLRKPGKPKLDIADNQRLRSWQSENTMVGWVVRPKPWEVEVHLIHQMKPPLNHKHNHHHPFFSRLDAARASFRDAAAP